MTRSIDNNSTSEQRIKKVVFRGGGTKGLLLAGTIDELEKMGAWDDVTEVWGSSAGGILSMLAGLGMNASDIKKELKEINFKDYMDKDTPFWSEALGIKEIDVAGVTNYTDAIPSLYSVLFSEGHGVYIGDAFSDYAKLKIAELTGNPGLTFSQLHDIATNPDNPNYDPSLKDICLTGSKIAPAPEELKLFNYKDTPDMPIWKAVRITMSFPGAFKAVEHDGSIFVDGGLKNNLPMDPAINFSNTDLGSVHLRTDPERGVIGVSMEKKEVIDHVKGKNEDKSIKNQDLGALDFGKGIVGGLVGGEIDVINRHKERVVLPDDKGEKTLNFDMTDSKKEELIAEGDRAAAELFIKRNDYKYYKDYHENLDVENIVKAWKQLKAFKAAGDLEDDIKAIEQKYKKFDIDKYYSSENEFREHLVKVYRETKQERKIAIEKAKQRKNINKEKASLYLAENVIEEVDNLINQYELKKNDLAQLENVTRSIIDLSKIMVNAVGVQDESVKKAISILNSHLKDAATSQNDEEKRNVIQKFLEEIKAIDISQEYKNNCISVFNSYLEYQNENIGIKLSSVTSLLEVDDYCNQLNLIHDGLTDIKQGFKKELIDLEKNIASCGLQMLHPDKAEKYTNFNNEDLTIEKLKQERNKLIVKYEKAKDSGKISDIIKNFNIKNYKKIVDAKREAYNNINQTTGFTVKLFDLLSKGMNFIYKGASVPSVLSPSWSAVTLMRKVEIKLKRLENNLIDDNNIHRFDNTSKNLIDSIEYINEKIVKTSKELNGFKFYNILKKSEKQSELKQYYKEMDKLLNSFEENENKLQDQRAELTKHSI